MNAPPWLALLDQLLGGIETVNANGTETITDSLFGIPLLVSTFNALNYTIDGGAGDDSINGGAGNDLLIGGAGKDTLRFDTDLALGSDTLDESGGGGDTLDLSATATRAVSIDLCNAAAQVVNAGLTLTLSAGNTVANVIGGVLGGTLTGNALNNSLSGGAGNDTLDSGAGTDVGINGEVLVNIP